MHGQAGSWLKHLSMLGWQFVCKLSHNATKAAPMLCLPIMLRLPLSCLQHNCIWQCRNLQFILLCFFWMCMHALTLCIEWVTKCALEQCSLGYAGCSSAQVQLRAWKGHGLRSRQESHLHRLRWHSCSAGDKNECTVWQTYLLTDLLWPSIVLWSGLCSAWQFQLFKVVRYGLSNQHSMCSCTCTQDRLTCT